jgi:uncharacterized membrane protein
MPAVLTASAVFSRPFADRLFCIQAAAAGLVTDLQKRCSDMAAKLQDERSTSIYRAEQIQLLQEQVQELQARVPEVDMDDVVAAGNLAAVHHIFY